MAEPCAAKSLTGMSLEIDHPNWLADCTFANETAFTADGTVFTEPSVAVHEGTATVFFQSFLKVGSTITPAMHLHLCTLDGVKSALVNAKEQQVVDNVNAGDVDAIPKGNGGTFESNYAVDRNWNWLGATDSYGNHRGNDGYAVFEAPDMIASSHAYCSGANCTEDCWMTDTGVFQPVHLAQRCDAFCISNSSGACSSSPPGYHSLTACDGSAVCECEQFGHPYRPGQGAPGCAQQNVCNVEAGGTCVHQSSIPWTHDAPAHKTIAKWGIATDPSYNFTANGYNVLGFRWRAQEWVFCVMVDDIWCESLVAPTSTFDGIPRGATAMGVCKEGTSTGRCDLQDGWTCAKLGLAKSGDTAACIVPPVGSGSNAAICSAEIRTQARLARPVIGAVPTSTATTVSARAPPAGLVKTEAWTSDMTWYLLMLVSVLLVMGANMCCRMWGGSKKEVARPEKPPPWS